MFHYTTLQQQRQTLIPCLCFRVQLLKPLNFLQQYWIVRFFEHVIVKITEQANWNERKRPNLVAGASSFLNRCTNKLRQLLVDPVWPLEGSKSGYEKIWRLEIIFPGRATQPWSFRRGLYHNCQQHSQTDRPADRNDWFRSQCYSTWIPHTLTYKWLPHTEVPACSIWG